MRVLHRLLALLLLAAAGLACGAPSVPAGMVELTAEIEMLRDPAGRLDFEAARASQQFRPLARRLNLGFTHEDAVWLRFEIAGADGPQEPRWLEVNSPLMDDIQLFLPRADGSIERRRSGDAQPLATRDLRYRNVVFRLDIRPGQTQAVYLRLQTRNAMLAAVNLWRNDAFLDAAAAESQLLGGFFGIALILLLSGMCFYFYLRESLHAWYLAYTSAILTASFGSVGWLYLHLLHPVPGLTDKVIGVTIALSVGCGASLYSRLLETDRYYPRATAVWRTAFWIVALLGCVGFLAGPYSHVAPLVQMAGLTLVVLVVPLALVLAWRRDRSALFFLAAFGPFTAGIVMRFMFNLGVLPVSAFYEHAYMLGTLVHMLLLNVSFIDRYRSLRRALDAAQAESLAASLRAEQSLESKVRERTVALDAEIGRRQALEEDLRRTVARVETALAVERRARSEQAEFVDMVSHEFRTPLAIIDSTAQMLLLTQPDAAPETRHRLGKIENAADRLTELIDRYLTNDRLALEDSELRLEACAVAPLIDEVAETTRSRDTGHAIEARLPGGDLKLNCDRALIRIALDNLLSNAVKYAPAGTPVTVAAERRDGEIVISVRDRGPGIAARDRESVFRKFIRGQNVAGTAGAGLGLYLVKRIVERHGGRVEIDSTPEHGTTAMLRFSAERGPAA